MGLDTGESSSMSVGTAMACASGCSCKMSMSATDRCEDRACVVADVVDGISVDSVSHKLMVEAAILTASCGLLLMENSACSRRTTGDGSGDTAL